MSNSENQGGVQLYLNINLLFSALISGLFAGITGSFGKMFIMTIQLHEDTWMYEPAFYFFFCVSIGCMIANLYNLNGTIALYRQMVVMPPFESCIIFGNMLSGGIIMKEFASFNAAEICLMIFGCLICVVGIMYKVYFYDMLSAGKIHLSSQELDNMDS